MLPYEILNTYRYHIKEYGDTWGVDGHSVFSEENRCCTAHPIWDQRDAPAISGDPPKYPEHAMPSRKPSKVLPSVLAPLALFVSLPGGDGNGPSIDKGGGNHNRLEIHIRGDMMQTSDEFVHSLFS